MQKEENGGVGYNSSQVYFFFLHLVQKQLYTAAKTTLHRQHTQQNTQDSPQNLPIMVV